MLGIPAINPFLRFLCIGFITGCWLLAAPGTHAAAQDAPDTVERTDRQAVDEAFVTVETLIREGEYDRAEVVLDRVRALPMSPEEQGRYQFLRAEVLWGQGKFESANQSFRAALPLVPDRFTQSGALFRMAEYAARQGDTAAAEDYADRSAELIPEEDWRLRQVGTLFLDLGMVDKGIDYLNRSLRASRTPAGDAASYAALAEAYKRLDNREDYLRTAGEYAATIAEMGQASSPDERGTAAFYRGEVLAARGDDDAAYQAYATASGLISDPFRLSEILMNMAEYQAGRGNTDQAASLAERSAALLPDQDWRLRQAGEVLLRLGRSDRGIALLDDSLAEAATVEGRLASLTALAEANRSLERQAEYLGYAENYAETVAGMDGEADDAVKGLAAYYRGDVLQARGEEDQAYDAYREASRYVTEPFRLSEIRMHLARELARRGETEQAAEQAEQAANALPQAWRLRQVAEFLIDLGMPERAAGHLRRYAERAETARDRAAAYSALAGLFSRQRDQAQFLRYARLFNQEVARAGYGPTPEEKGLQSYYAGEIFSAEGDDEQAYTSYAAAAESVTDPYRLSDILLAMARYRAKEGDRDGATALAERSLEQLPDQAWRVVEIGDFYNGLDLPQRAIDLYERAIELAPAMKDRTAAYTALAEVYKKLGNQERYIEYARLFIDAIEARGGAQTDGERGLVAFYRGEILLHDGDEDGAFQLFSTAFDLFTEPFRLSDIAMKQAEYFARRKDNAASAAWAERSAAILPEEGWRQRDAGDILMRVELTDRAIGYYQRALDLATTPETRASAYAALAEAYKKLENQERYLLYARHYADTVESLGEGAGGVERGMAAFYRGEIFTALGDADRAYRAYELATRLLEDPYRLSELFLTMAKYNQTQGRPDLAAEQAERSANLLPDKDWRVGEAADILGRLCRFDAAVAVVERAVTLNRTDNAHLYRSLSNIFSRARNRNCALVYNARFIDLQTEKVCRLGAAAPRQTVEDLWNARDSQSGMSRTWGLDSYYFGKRWEGGNYFLGMSHELFRNYSLPNGMNGKVYGILDGTLKAHYSGRYYENSQISQWDSRPYFRDTARFLIGASINPFRNRLLAAMSFNAEYAVGIGRDMKDDFRFRLGYDRTSGERPRLHGRLWKYWKAYSNTTWSTRKNDITSVGDFRLGATFAPGGGTLLFMPHALVTYDYGGKTVDKGDRWGFDVGPGIAVRKWFRGGKYTTPRSNIELHVYYHIALTHERKNGVGFTLSTSF